MMRSWSKSKNQYAIGKPATDRIGSRIGHLFSCWARLSEQKVIDMKCVIFSLKQQLARKWIKSAVGFFSMIASESSPFDSMYTTTAIPIVSLAIIPFPMAAANINHNPFFARYLSVSSRLPWNGFDVDGNWMDRARDERWQQKNWYSKTDAPMETKKI